MRPRADRSTPAVIALTAGDPCGVGPEVILKALPAAPAGRFVIIGDWPVFERTARRLKRRLPSWDVRDAAAPWVEPSRVTFLDCGFGADFRPGISSARAGRAALPLGRFVRLDVLPDADEPSRGAGEPGQRARRPLPAR